LGEIFIVGAGTYGEVMCDLAQIIGYTVKGFYDEDKKKLGSSIMGVEVIGRFSELTSKDIKNKSFIVAIGNNEIRYEMMNRINLIGGSTPTLIHPTAIVSPTAIIGKGVYIQANAYIWTKAHIKDFCIISPGVIICHHSTVGYASLVSTHTSVGASIEIKDKVFIGMGSTIMTGVTTIGENSIIGAGAVVTKNTDKYCVYAGVPAKKLREIEVSTSTSS